MNRLKKRLEHDFNEHHIALVWAELHDRFGFDIKKWKLRFNEYVMTQPRGVSEVEAFFKFGNTYIGPLINEIRCRPTHYPTFNNMLAYIINKN